MVLRLPAKPNPFTWLSFRSNNTFAVPCLWDLGGKDMSIEIAKLQIKSSLFDSVLGLGMQKYLGQREEQHAHNLH
jgi:hypothetical protein